MRSPQRGDWTTIGIFTFRLGDQRYADFCRTVARCMMRLHGARLHWGKFFPISAEEARASHPRFERFEAVCRRYDPAGRFAYTFLDGRS